MARETFGVTVGEANWPEVQRVFSAIAGATSSKESARKGLAKVLHAAYKQQLAEERTEPGEPDIE